MTDHLEERFERIQRPGDGDWADVLRRAERRSGRRRLVLVAALGAVVALGAPTALALRGSLVDFFQSEPAPQRVVLDFAQLDVGAPPGLETEVIAEQTRKILEQPGYDGRAVMLWVAPTRKGGFCMYLDHGGSGCVPPHSVPVGLSIGIRGPITPGGVIRRGPVLISGSVSLAGADAIDLRYEDGTADRQRLTSVSKPIDAAFFVFDVEPRHWNGNRQPKSLVVVDAEGRALRTEPLHFVLPSPVDPTTGAPKQALLDQARKLIAIQTHTGMEAALWVAPTRDGRSCYWLRHGRGGFGSSCPEKSFFRPFGLVRSQGSGVVLLWGGPLRQDIEQVEVRYEDGERVSVRPVEGMVLYEIPPAHFPRGHRPNLLIARDVDGRELARQTIDTDVYGAYPCRKPVAIGGGEEACP